MITQELLGEYVELTRLIQRRAELRELILCLLGAGVPVECGALTVNIRRGERRALTIGEVKAVLGEANFQNLMAEIRPVPFCHLIVGPRNSGWGATRPVREPRI